MKRAVITFVLNAVIMACHPSDGSSPDSAISGASGQGAFLGTGFNILSATFTGNNCFEGGEVQQHAIGSSDLIFKRNMDYGELKRLFDGSVGITVPITVGVTATGSARYASQYESSHYSEVLTLGFHAQTVSERLYLRDLSAPTLKITPPVERTYAYAAKHSDVDLAREIRAVCGHEYIGEVIRGMSIIANMKVEFANEYDKEAFGGGLQVDLAGGVVSGSIDVGFEKIKASAQANITLEVTQRGGTPLALLDIFPEASEDDGNMLYLQCDFKDRQHCLDSFKRILDYTNALHKQFSNGDDASYRNDVPLQFITHKYPEAGTLTAISTPSQTGAIEQDIKNSTKILNSARQLIYKNKGQLLANLKRVEALSGSLGIHITDDLEKKMTDLKKKITKNLDITVAAEAACANISEHEQTKAIEECQQSTNKVAQINLPSKEDLVVKPENFYSWCVLSLSSELLNTEDKQTTFAILESVEAGSFSVEEDHPDASQILDEYCTSAQTKIAYLTDLNIDRTDQFPFLVTSLRPLQSATKLRSLSAKNQYLDNVMGLEDLKDLQNIDVTDNYFVSLDPLHSLKSQHLDTLNIARNHVESFSNENKILNLSWSKIDLSDNQIVEVSPFTTNKSLHLILDDNPVHEASSLAQIDNLQRVSLVNTDLSSCPLPIDSKCEF